MIRELRVKLVVIIMAFATVILACVMAAVLGLTRATLEHESLDMMRHIALNPIQVPAPGEEFDGVRLPYLCCRWARTARSSLQAAATMICPTPNFCSRRRSRGQRPAERRVDGQSLAFPAAGHRQRQYDCICRYIERNANLNWIVPYLPAALQCGVYCVLKSA